jgi:hypothetical protein
MKTLYERLGDIGTHRHFPADIMSEINKLKGQLTLEQGAMIPGHRAVDDPAEKLARAEKFYGAIFEIINRYDDNEENLLPSFDAIEAEVKRYKGELMAAALPYKEPRPLMPHEVPERYRYDG